MGEIAKHLVNMRNQGKLAKAPKFDMHVYVPSKDEPRFSEEDETKYLKKDLKRETEKISKYEKILRAWVPEDVAAKAKKEVERQLAECRIRVSELKAKIKVRS